MNAETDALLAALDGARGHVLGILDGLSAEDLRRPLLPTGWTCLGLIHHLALDVERFWFRMAVAGEPLPLPEKDGWQVPEGMSDAMPTRWPDEIFPHDPTRPMRKVMLHVINETATHAGHLDAARELIDGTTWLILNSFLAKALTCMIGCC